MNPPRPQPFVIGVAGGSGSGKSTVTREVLKSIGPEMVAVVFHKGFRFKSLAAMDDLLRHDADSLPEL